MTPPTTPGLWHTSMFSLKTAELKMAELLSLKVYPFTLKVSKLAFSLLFSELRNKWITLSWLNISYFCYPLSKLCGSPQETRQDRILYAKTCLLMNAFKVCQKECYSFLKYKVHQTTRTKIKLQRQIGLHVSMVYTRAILLCGMFSLEDLLLLILHNQLNSSILSQKDQFVFST